MESKKGSIEKRKKIPVVMGDLQWRGWQPIFSSKQTNTKQYKVIINYLVIVR